METFSLTNNAVNQFKVKLKIYLMCLPSPVDILQFINFLVLFLGKAIKCSASFSKQKPSMMSKLITFCVQCFIHNLGTFLTCIACIIVIKWIHFLYFLFSLSYLRIFIKKTIKSTIISLTNVNVSFMNKNKTRNRYIRFYRFSLFGSIGSTSQYPIPA